MTNIKPRKGWDLLKEHSLVVFNLGDQLTKARLGSGAHPREVETNNFRKDK